MITIQECHQTSVSVQHWHQLLESGQHLLHARPCGWIVQMAAQNHHLTLLSHFVGVLELWVPAVYKKIRFVFVLFSLTLRPQKTSALDVALPALQSDI